MVFIEKYVFKTPMLLLPQNVFRHADWSFSSVTVLSHEKLTLKIILMYIYRSEIEQIVIRINFSRIKSLCYENQYINQFHTPKVTVSDRNYLSFRSSEDTRSSLSGCSSTLVNEMRKINIILPQNSFLCPADRMTLLYIFPDN